MNSRDELSLANVVSGFISHADFNVVKNEAKNSKMPLFQVDGVFFRICLFSNSFQGTKMTWHSFVSKHSSRVTAFSRSST